MFAHNNPTPTDDSYGNLFTDASWDRGIGFLRQRWPRDNPLTNCDFTRPSVKVSRSNPSVCVALLVCSQGTWVTGKVKTAWNNYSANLLSYLK
jgi:hypothetical protein